MSAQSGPSKPMCGSIKTCFQSIVIAFALVFKHFRYILTNEVFSNKNAHCIRSLFVIIIMCKLPFYVCN
jgi:hypothetical protein